MTHWMLLLGLAACGSSTRTAAPGNTTPPSPTETTDFLSPDGARVATVRVYEGDCMPAGSRGGCHSITLRPDGTARNFLFDAAVDGTYTIAGGNVTITGNDTVFEPLPLSADGKTLGSLTLKRVGAE